MKMAEALRIINSSDTPPGYMVHFERSSDGRVLRSDYFPDSDEGDALIETETRAWYLARKFAENSRYHIREQFVNIYVVDALFRPVPGYKSQAIKNR